ncbi:hypothetical protein MADA3029_390002 [Vibrio nigripulchritudo MADA3029]|uniref:helix-turn-helix domain-containing protein n=1 Tax=Vibrio nigripulchritudo TaxID=28173 RepID=UPI0003B1C5DA|nr:helix-turn-helix domain-containing protein [Vibrio nigripulchritudo]KJY79937.1 hypothetical protein TW74_06160 [Vibrio nigripulchritudo]CCN50201.1 hypothetical protein VIBNIMADA3020_880002 [Vibrio nigripulchritudo MADA3020]CCN53243.1 hypothetical protein VIBNIMADA3021_250008 [Vibrio nigripulchritudo MADA3021]CCN59233.1 hypothetical protein MADA3029_390002 [Vibrio nigripulchritudo MADA3029]
METEDIPQELNESDMDAMVEFFSLELEEVQKEIVEIIPFENVSSKHDRDAILERCIEALLHKEELDQVSLSYLINNLRLLIEGSRAFKLPRGRAPLSYVDQRWRACVVKYVSELGATQAELAEILGVSERLIQQWMSFAKTEVRSYTVTKEYIETLLEDAGSSYDHKGIIRALSDYRRIEIY